MNQAYTIKQFRFHAKYISIDWNALRQAAKVSIPDGLTNVFVSVLGRIGYRDGIWLNISPAEIIKFSFEKETAEEPGEIFLLTKDEKLGLGITAEYEIAEKWVWMANQILENAKYSIELRSPSLLANRLLTASQTN